jgi:hypothetical protein
MRPKNKRNPQDSNPLLLTPLILLTPFAVVFSPHCAVNTAASCARTSCAQRARFRSAESAAASMLQQHLMLLQCSAVQWHSQCDLSLSLLLPLLLPLLLLQLLLHDCCLFPSPLLLVSHSEPLFHYVALCRQHQQVTLHHSAVVL